MKRLCIVIVTLLLVGGCMAKPNEAPKGKIKNIKADAVMEKMDQKETMILVVGTSTCGSCVEFEEVLKAYVQDHKATFYLLKTDDEPTIKDQDGKEVRQNYLDLQARIGKIHITPTIVLIVDGQVKSMQSGGWDEKAFLKLLKSFDKIKQQPATLGTLHYQSSEQVIEAIQNKASMILVIGKTSCGACIHFRETIHNVLVSDQVTITEILLDKEPSMEGKDGKTVLPNFETLTGLIGEVEGTPTTFKIEEGVVVDSLFGALSESELRAFITGSAA